MISFVADESIDRQIVSALRPHYEVVYIAEGNAGIMDEEVLDICIKKRAILVTADKDFGELVYRFKKRHFGVVLCRLTGIGPYEKAEIVKKVLDNHADELNGNFTVITKDGTRIRKPV